MHVMYIRIEAFHTYLVLTCVYDNTYQQSTQVLLLCISS